MSDTEITFLIVSDSHENINKAKELVAYLLKRNKKIDYVIHCGDIVTVPNQEQHLEKSVTKYEPLIKEFIEELEKLNTKVIYVPGNHEPFTLFKGDDAPLLTPTSINLHSTSYKIKDDLYIIGVGGSTPILHGDKYQIQQVPFSDLDLKNVKWAGYPYDVPGEGNFVKSDQMLDDDLRKGLTKVKEENKDAQIILLSHNGPLYTWTNLMVLNGENLFLGSEKIGKILMEEKNIFLNFHGHTHEAKGVVQLGEGKTVMNPGDLEHGNYGLCTIKKNTENNKWEIVGTKLNTI